MPENPCQRCYFYISLQKNRVAKTFVVTKRAKRKKKIVSSMVITPISQNKGYKRFYNYVSNVECLNANNSFESLNQESKI